MLKLHVVQAAFGDCLLLEYGNSSPARFLLIDGGPPDIYRLHLKQVLGEVARKGGKLDRVVLSHVDADHVSGLLDYFAELQIAGHGLPVPQGLWHNAFSQTVDPNGVLEPRLKALMASAMASVLSESGFAVQGISEGASLRAKALAAHVPINDDFGGKPVIVDKQPQKFTFDDLEITLVGPTKANLDELKKEWKDWLDSAENNIASLNPFVMANSDRSVPNLSSIMFFARGGDRTMLFTGDGRSDHLIDGLKQAKLLSDNGTLHVDVLKLPHHGSNRNITKTFFTKITADIYVASANGRDDNPDLATLIWLVEAAKQQNRKARIVVTNQTDSVKQLQKEYPKGEYGYTLEILASGKDTITV